ncbi:hypothetical protein [Longimicrobium sp.]|uniref:hypothetical protein n=1 Tax=Longimicrobium sp. TaxID=2029185 RepID=UPI002C0E6F7A|nr:hypothetical protein [Longimicrobium sp.]HSU14198.1 hypothetical protein [Longimicrobium sp.]
METQLNDLDTLDLWPQDEDEVERIVLARMRAAGVQLATEPLSRPRITVRQRPRWWAFILRTLRLT